MDSEEFKQLRDLPGKRITSDIRFELQANTKPAMIFENVVVENTGKWQVMLNGTYNPRIPSLVLNFRVMGVGPICRLCVNKERHKDAGRTHKHELINEEDSHAGNLPIAFPRPDLEGKDIPEIWRTLCEQANIEHTGRFIAPGGG